MEMKLVNAFMENREQLRSKLSEAHPSSYKDLVSMVFSVISDGEYGSPSTTKIHEIDDGEYQGTLLYLIPAEEYQPSDYYLVKVSYGSCSGCDTLQRINDYSDEKPRADQVDDYLTLALHIVQSIQKV